MVRQQERRRGRTFSMVSSRVYPGREEKSVRRLQAITTHQWYRVTLHTTYPSLL